MPPSPLSLLWPTMLMPKKLYFSVVKRTDEHQHCLGSFINTEGSKKRRDQEVTDPC